MTNYQFLQTYVELQQGIMFDEIVDLDFATLCYSKLDSSPFWNNALIDIPLTDDQISQVEKKLTELERKPAFYFENRSDLQLFSETLTQRGYKQNAEDSLIFHMGESIDEGRFNQVKKVETETELEVYIQTFDNCFQKDDPQNPYGELGEYLEACRSAWHKHHESNKIEYFIVYKDDQPVAVSTLTNHKNLGYISNVGSLRSVRGEGFGKLATMYCVAQSKKNGNTVHSIATEEGTYPNQFYKKIGFETRFTSKLMVKDVG